MIKAERGHLVWLDRLRDEHEVTLKSSVITPEETATLLALVERHLAGIEQSDPKVAALVG